MSELAREVEFRIVDAMVQDFLDHGELDTHEDGTLTVVKYRRPVAVFPSDCPMLCVWLLDKTFGQPTNLKSHDPISIGVSWQEEAVERAETLIAPGEDEAQGYAATERAESLIRNLKHLERRVRSLAGFDGYESSPHLVNVPELDMILPRDWDYLPPQAVDTGLVEGYAMTVEVTVVE